MARKTCVMPHCRISEKRRTKHHLKVYEIEQAEPLRAQKLLPVS
ncbi:hypothetical protein MESS4_790021 [Mesorhizobium sp. STM 4661]|nr:hypothetical protein MESS4_790021 [Mesorhizobium sp. STM 4661]